MDITTITCKVCEEHFTDSPGPRIPRILSACGHTICEMCCLKIKDDQKIMCPFDRQQTVAPDGSVQRLKKNFSIMEAVEDENWKKRAQLKTDNYYTAERALNIPCDEDGSHVAVVRCEKCEVNLCELCSHLTHSTKTQSAHIRVRLTKLTNAPRIDAKCPVHPYNVGDLYCKQPECTASTRVMCITCHHYGIHKGHEFRNQEEECIRFKKELTNAAEQVEEQIRELELKLKTATTTSASYTDVDLKNKKREVENRFTMIEKYCEDYRSQMFEKLEKDFEYLKLDSVKKESIVNNNLQKFKTLRSIVQSLLKMDKLELAGQDVESILFDCGQEPILPQHFVCCSSIRLRLPDLPVWGSSAVFGKQIVFYHMGDTEKLEKIFHWLEKNSVVIRRDNKNRSLTVFYEKQTVTFWNEIGLVDSFVTKSIKYVVLVDHYSSEEKWRDLFKTFEYFLEKDPGLKQNPVVIAINKYVKDSGNATLKEIIGNLKE